MTAPRYALVSPCRDEEKFARRTLDSVVRQTLRPSVWVIVDDGSTDGTPEILAEYAREHNWIEIVRREDRGGRQVGPGVIEAFYAGFAKIDAEAFDYVCKLDLDLDLPPNYFADVIDRMEQDPRYGTCSGKAYFIDKDGQKVLEAIGDDVSVGAAKLYRTACFRQIGGLVREVMWDGIDVHRCRMLGWKVRSWNDEEIQFEHLRPMGSSHRGILEGRRRHGRGQYYMGTGPLFLIASALLRVPRHPFLVGSLAMLQGYFGAWLQRAPRHEDRDFRRHLRRYHRDCLLRGKSFARDRTEERCAARWDPTLGPQFEGEPTAVLAP